MPHHASSLGPRAGTMGWFIRREQGIQDAQALICRGLRATVTSELTGIPLEMCQAMRLELMPDAQPTRAQLPSGAESRCLRSGVVYRAGSVFLAAYLGILGRKKALKGANIGALVAGYDVMRDACSIAGWKPISMDYSYVIAREIANPEGLLIEYCSECDGPYMAFRGISYCPACAEINT